MRELIDALKEVGCELDALHNASRFHAVVTELSWNTVVNTGEMTEEIRSVRFQVISQATVANPIEPQGADWALAFELCYPTRLGNGQPELSVAWVNSNTGEVRATTDTMTVEDLFDLDESEIHDMLLDTITGSPLCSDLMLNYLGSADSSGWLDDVANIFKGHREAFKL